MTETRWHTLYPELGTGPIAIEPYISPAYFELERERIFRRVWLNVAREDAIPQANDFIVVDLEVCRASILLTRDDNGDIHAFHNVCSHRCNKLVYETKGSVNSFSCRFHGWTYTSEGQLSYVPDRELFFDLQPDTLGLTPVAVDTWQGFIFINLEPNPEESLRTYLGELGDLLDDYPFDENSTTCYGWITDIRANWKIVKDAFQETYHVAFVHSGSNPDTLTGPDNPYCHGFDFKLYPRHHRMSVKGNPEHRPGAVEAVARQVGGTFVRSNFESQASSPPTSETTPNRPQWLDMNVFFPNFFVDTAAVYYFTYHMWPLAVDRTRWEVRLYAPQAQNAGQRFSQEYSKVMLRDALLEDASTLEHTQTALTSGAKTHFILQDQELLIRHDYHVIEEHVGYYRQGAQGHGS